jgi:putative phosphoesterase
MKIFVASDIHGSAFWCRKMIEAYKTEKADLLLLLGDILYHGPRNDLPEEYAPKQVLAMLNELKSDIMCVRGNCDTEVDQMVLDFSVLSETALLFADGKKIIATHGHIKNDENPPAMAQDSLLLCGHTHIQGIKECDGFTYVNPGSVSIPKGGTPNGYAIIEKGEVILKSL